jgi:prenyl protein peptidase
MVYPLLLTMLLFLGPISVQLTSGIYKIYSEPTFWLNHFQNLLWLRNHVVAPLSEEFTFRACMLPLLLQSFSPMTAIFITPLFFGVGRLKKEKKMKTQMKDSEVFDDKNEV